MVDERKRDDDDPAEMETLGHGDLELISGGVARGATSENVIEHQGGDDLLIANNGDGSDLSEPPNPLAHKVTGNFRKK